MNIPKTVQEAFYNNFLGEAIFDNEIGLKQREYYEEFVENTTHPDVNVREKYWYGDIIDYTWEVVERGYYINSKDMELAIKKFDNMPVKKRLEVMQKYDLFDSALTNTHKAVEIFMDWFNEMYLRTVKIINESKK